MSEPAFFHQPSGTVRFWVLVDGQWVGASIGKEVLHYRYKPNVLDDDPLETYNANALEIDATVRRRVAGGSIEPVMLRGALPTKSRRASTRSSPATESSVKKFVASEIPSSAAPTPNPSNRTSSHCAKQS